MKNKTTILKSFFVFLIIVLGMLVNSTLVFGQDETNESGENLSLYAQDTNLKQVVQKKQEQEDKLDWFHEAKFGLFLHWGLYAVPAGEWDGNTNHAEWIQYTANIPGEEYVKFANQFNPTKFNAKEWVSLAKQAGMKYIVITAKHHEGFCMYDSKLTNYDIVDATPYGKDPMKELAAECKKQGIKFCFYYSIQDWHHKNYPIEYTRFDSKMNPEGYIGFPEKNEPDYSKYFSYMREQVKELLTNYGPVGIIWFDWPGSAFASGETKNRMMAKQLVDSIHEWQPECLINNRLAGMGDYGTPEQVIPGSTQKEAFETCMTISDRWGYNKFDDNWKSPEELIYNLCDIASKGGNFLLNIGPTAEGVLPREPQDILKKVGRWLDVNGESIYNTSSSGINVRWNPDIEMVTAKPGTYYLHMFNYPDDHKVYMKLLENKKVEKAYLLADKQEKPLKVDYYPRGGIIIHLPENPVHPFDIIYNINNVVVVKYIDE